MDQTRLQQQLAFIMEIDKLKTILRQTLIGDASRRENSAEHSWSLAVMAILLSEHATAKEIDLMRVVKMLLIHDVVEIDAGDTFAYDDKGYEDKEERERAAFERIFGLLPEDQRAECRSLWEEFEARDTPEAKYATSLDRLHPMLLNYSTEGHAWRKHGISADRVLGRNAVIEAGSGALWDYAKDMVEQAVKKGYLLPAPEGAQR